ARRLDEPDPEEERRAKQRAYHQMQRFKVSARAADFPQLARLLKRGTPAEKKEVMRGWMETNGNCAAMEGRLKLTAKMTARSNELEELLTVRKMREKGIS
ncbi:unnamed protein product, partial [Effrenium voratum]